MLTGFHSNNFQELYTLLVPLFKAFTPFSKDADGSYLVLNTNKTSGSCPQSVESITGLAIVFSWTCTQNATWVQFILFGVSASTLRDWLHFGCHYWNIVIYSNHLAKFEMGSDQKNKIVVRHYYHKYPDLGNAYLDVDGLERHFQKPGG